MLFRHPPSGVPGRGGHSRDLFSDTAAVLRGEARRVTGSRRVSRTLLARPCFPTTAALFRMKYKLHIVSMYSTVAALSTVDVDIFGTRSKRWQAMIAPGNLGGAGRPHLALLAAAHFASSTFVTTWHREYAAHRRCLLAVAFFTLPAFFLDTFVHSG